MLVCVVELVLDMIFLSVCILVSMVCVIKARRGYVRSLWEITIAVFLLVISAVIVPALLLMIFFGDRVWPLSSFWMKYHQCPRSVLYLAGFLLPVICFPPHVICYTLHECLHHSG